MNAADYILEFKGISKAFVGVQALKDITFSIRKGDVHALLGENGAGKSTLMKILSGAYTKDEGEVWIDGWQVNISNPKEAEKLGVAIIYQELNLFPDITVAENIFLCRQPKSKGKIDWHRMNQDAKKLLDEIDVDLDPKHNVGSLSIAQQQMVEIAKAISLNSKILVMDEPTSTLTDGETRKLFRVIENLKSKGITIIYISHRMEEIFSICDSYSVLRDGTFIHSGEIKDVNVDKIIEYMVGRSLSLIYPEKKNVVGQTVLEVQDISDGKKIHDVSFELKKGEILGFAGLVGAGRTETMRLIFGADKKKSGTITINSKKAAISTPQHAIKYGIGFVPEDRKKEGLIIELSVMDNVVMAKMKTAFQNCLFSAKKAKDISQKYMKSLAIKTPSARQFAKFLSGGNQQKVVLAKWLNCDPQIIIMDEPTRGIDVNAKMEIYNIIISLAEQGKSIIVVSSEMPELIGICDRILVMHEGAITGSLQRNRFDQNEIMRLATGGK